MLKDWQRIAARVAARRHDLRLTQLELAVRSHTSESTVRAIESARRKTYRASTLRAIADALGWTPDSLDRIGRGDEPVETGHVERPATVEDRVAALEAQLRGLERELQQLRRAAS